MFAGSVDDIFICSSSKYFKVYNMPVTKVYKVPEWNPKNFDLTLIWISIIPKIQTSNYRILDIKTRCTFPLSWALLYQLSFSWFCINQVWIRQMRYWRLTSNHSLMPPSLLPASFLVNLDINLEYENQEKRLFLAVRLLYQT